MIARRKALRLGVAASAVALSGSSTGRAADPLTIGPEGVNVDNLWVAKNLTVAGNAGFKTTAGANTVDIQSAIRQNPDTHPKNLALYVTAESSKDGGLVEFRHSNGSQGIGIGFNTIYAAGSNADQELNLKPKGDKPVQIQSALTVDGAVTLKTSLTVKGGVQINGKNALEFGVGIKKEGSAGQIAYQAHSGDALDIVGAGESWEARKIKLWAEGGATLVGSLTVTGNLGIGTLSVPGSVEPLRMLRGIVNSDGTRFGGGEGFTVRRFATGLYDITFTSPFPSVPAASATQIYGFASTGNAPATSTGSGDTRDNAVIAHLSADRMRVKTGGGGGEALDRVFSFIVIGPR